MRNDDYAARSPFFLAGRIHRAMARPAFDREAAKTAHAALWQLIQIPTADRAFWCCQFGLDDAYLKLQAEVMVLAANAHLLE